MRILGIDPGSRVTGFGVIDSDGRRSSHLENGCIRLADASLPERLGVIFTEVQRVVDAYSPQELAIEDVFVSRNPGSALKLGQARGAAICAAVCRGVTVSEYSARSIKLALVGNGGAAKEQVQDMVARLLGLGEAPPSDAADALGVALCHAHTRFTTVRTMPNRRGSWA